MACVYIYEWCGKITAVQLNPVVRMMDWSHRTPMEAWKLCSLTFFFFFWGLFALPPERPNSFAHSIAACNAHGPIPILLLSFHWDGLVPLGLLLLFFWERERERERDYFSIKSSIFQGRILGYTLYLFSQLARVHQIAAVDSCVNHIIKSQVWINV